MALLAIPGNFALTRYLVRKNNAGKPQPPTIQISHFDMNTEAHAVELTAPAVPPQWEKFELLAPNRNPATCLAGSIHYFRVIVTNRSEHLLYSGLKPTPDNPKVNIAYRIFDSTGSTAIAESERYFLRHSLLPQKLIGTLPQLPVDGEIRCPDKSGDYIVRIELVQEGVAWMTSVKNHGPIVERKIRSIAAAAPETPKEWVNAVPVESSSAVKSIPSAPPPPVVVAAFRIAAHTLLGSLSVLWRGEVPYLTANAGSNYPMIWVRDLASIQMDLPGLLDNPPPVPTVGGAQHHWSEIFLADQCADGRAPDWIAPNHSVGDLFFDKNDVTSDQELWLVHAALQSVASGRLQKSWLQMAIGGRTVEYCLTNALKYVFEKYWERSRSCLASGHTADWGDVGPEGTDVATATKLTTSGRSRVCSIYSQALLYKVLSLAEPLIGAEVHSRKVISELGGIAKLKSAVEIFASKSWDESRGMYRVHEHVMGHSPHRASFDESSMFALGGNILAILADLSPPDRARRTLSTIVALKNQFGNATISASLIPPYPAGTFDIPIMQHPGKYQNGGFWDWHGARAIRQMKRFGMASTASEELYAISELAAGKGHIYEWYSFAEKSEKSKKSEFVGPGFVAAAAAILSNLDTSGINK